MVILKEKSGENEKLPIIEQQSVIKTKAYYKSPTTRPWNL
jgi:hypothetical protein